LKLKCTKFDFGWGSTPGLALGVYSTPQDLLDRFHGPISTENGGEEDIEKGRGRKGME